MDKPDGSFLPTIIGILEGLRARSVEQGAANLAFLLDLAKAEAQDELRHADLEARLRTKLKETSTVGAWH